MGHWSEEPYDNDGAMDLLPDYHYAIFKAIKQEVYKWDLTDLNRFPYDEIRCTAQYIIDYLEIFSVHTDDAYLVCAKILEALNIIDNSTYFECWRDPVAFRTSLEGMIVRMKDIESKQKEVYDLFNGDE